MMPNMNFVKINHHIHTDAGAHDWHACAILLIIIITVIISSTCERTQTKMEDS